VNSSDARRLGEEAARRLALTGRHEIGSALTDAGFARIEQTTGSSSPTITGRFSRLDCR
jgi:hypothetical protein